MTTITLKIEPGLKEKAQAIAREFGLSLSALIKAFLKKTILTGKFDMDIKPRYHTGPEPGDIVFKNSKDAVAYFKKLADENGDMEEDISERL